MKWDSAEWGESNDILILGSSKSNQIEDIPLLKKYHEDFEEIIKKAKKLMIIGYSFADYHINQKIFDAVENHGLKFWIIDVAPLTKLIRNAAYQPENLLRPEIKRMKQPLKHGRPGSRGYHDSELFEEVLLPEYKNKFKKGLISITNCSLRDIFTKNHLEFDRINESFFD